MSNKTLVESLKRLYAKGKVTKDKLQESLQKGTITAEDYQEITGEAYGDE